MAVTGAPAERDALGELTPQQRQIVRLASDGLTDREIGDRLFLSPRTVSSHLYRSYPKLGVASRHQLRDVIARASTRKRRKPDSSLVASPEQPRAFLAGKCSKPSDTPPPRSRRRLRPCEVTRAHKKDTSVNFTRIGRPGRLGQRRVREIVPGVFRVGTTFLGCYAVEDAGAYTFIDAGLPGYGPR